MSRTDAGDTADADSLRYAINVLKYAAAKLGCEFQHLHQVEIETLLLVYFDGIELVKPTTENELGYYVVSEQSALDIAEVALKNHSVAMMANIIATANLLSDKPLPKPLRENVIRRMWHGLIPEAFAPPKKRYPKRFVQKFYVHLAAMGVADRYRIPLTRSNASPEHSACDVVSKAAASLGVSIPYTRIRDWCNHRDHEVFRETSEYIAEIICNGRFPVAK